MSKYKKIHIKIYKYRHLKVGRDREDKMLIEVHDQLDFDCLKEGTFDNFCVVFTGNCRFLNLEIIL